MMALAVAAFVLALFSFLAIACTVAFALAMLRKHRATIGMLSSAFAPPPE